MSLTKIIIEKIRNLDLNTVEIDEIKSLIYQLGKFALMAVDISKDAYVLRGRVDSSLCPYKSQEDFSYIKDENKVFAKGRVNREKQSIFYGCTSTDDEDYCQLQSMFEITGLLDDHSPEKDEEYIAMGKWRVKKPFTAWAIVHHKDFIEKNDSIAHMHENYLTFLENYPEKKEDYFLISEYFSSEFGKVVRKGNEHEYKISIAFAEVLFEYGIEAILYPTVKDEGKGFNIAILKHIVDTKLEYAKALIWRVLKNEKHILPYGYLFTDSFNDLGELCWEDTLESPSLMKKLSDKKLPHIS